MDSTNDCKDNIKIEFVEQFGSIDEQPPPVRKTRIVTETEFKLSEGYIFDSDVQIEESKVKPSLLQELNRHSSTSVMSNILKPLTPNFQCESIMLKCHVCRYETKSAKALQNHVYGHRVKRVNGMRNFQCKKCPKKYFTHPEVTRHMKINTDLRPHKCAEKYFLKYLNRPPPYKCEICGYTSNHKNHLEKHVLRHAGARNFECKQCSKKFYTIVELRQHTRVHTGERPYQCDICSSRFAIRSNLSAHIKMHIQKSKPSLSPTYECYICGDAVRYKKETYLKNHMREYHIDGTVHACNICGEKFSFRNHLNRHLQVHNSEPTNFPTKSTTATTAKLYKCSFCEYTSKYNNHLKIHSRKHTGEKPYKCQLCPKAFSGNSHLRRHERAVHATVKSLKCNKCSTKFKDKSTLSLHIRQKHLGYTVPKKFKCRICLLRLPSKTNLEIHLRVHTKEKPFKCVNCSKSFSIKSNLERHSREVPCRRVYECEYCCQTFQQLNFLKRHLRSHKIMQYECYICGFKSRMGDRKALYRLRMHMTKHEKALLRKELLPKNKKLLKVIPHTSLNHTDKRISDKKVLGKLLTRNLRCSHCTFRFSHQQSLMDHMERIHYISFNCSLKISKN